MRVTVRNLIQCLLGILLVSGSASFAACNTALPESTPFVSFIDNGDGTVTHTTTGLMWMRCSLGQSWDGAACAGSALQYGWADALQAAGDATYAGHSDWRLPNAKELMQIVESRCYRPAINEAVFASLPPLGEQDFGVYYKTSTPASAFSDHAYVVDFWLGSDPEIRPKLEAGYARLVRNGEGS